MRARVLVSVAVAATVALGAGGCAFMTPQETVDIRQIADGVEVNVGSVDVRNALFITDGDGPARFIGTMINNTGTERTVSVQVKGDTQTVVVPADSHVDLGGSTSTSPSNSSAEQSSGSTLGTDAAQGSQELVFDDADLTPGALAKTYFSYSGVEGASVAVPILTGAQEEYAHLVPTQSPSPSRTPGSEVTLPVETPEATPTESPSN